MEDVIKNIFLEKRFFELTPNEKSMIKEWAETEEEFEALKLTLLSTASLKDEKLAELSPSVKSRLNERFAAKHIDQKEMWLNKLAIFFFPKDVQFFKKPAFQLTIVALTVALVVPFLWQNDTPQYAMNESDKRLEPTIIESDSVSTYPMKNENQNGKIIASERFDMANDDKVNEIVEDQPITNLEERFVERVVTIGPVTDQSAKGSVPKINLKEISIDLNSRANDELAITNPTITNEHTMIPQRDEFPMFVNKNMDKELVNQNPQQVDVSETLGFLTALY